LRIHTQHRSGFHHIQSLSFRRTFRLWDVYKNNITKLFCSSDKSCSGAGETGADYRYFASFHAVHFLCNQRGLHILDELVTQLSTFPLSCMIHESFKICTYIFGRNSRLHRFDNEASRLCQPRCSGRLTPECTRDGGATSFRPGSIGAVPCVGRKNAWPVLYLM